jgi:aquaporin Z
MDRNLRPYLAELIGSFALVLLSAGVVIAGPASAGVVGIALAQGFILAALLSATARVSGGFLNPAVTLTLWVFKRLEGNKASWLIGAQVLGAVVAGLCLRFMFRPDLLGGEARFGTPHLTLETFGTSKDSFPSMPILLSGIGFELAFGFIVAFTIFATMIDRRSPPLGGLPAGLALSACAMMGLHLTGAAVNPARWLGTVVWELTVPALRAQAFHDHAVYWIGPTLGTLLAGAAYFLVIGPEEEKS